MYSNKLDDLVNSSDKADVIWQPVRNFIAQFAELEVRVANNSELEEEAIENSVRNRFNISIFL